MQNVVVICVLAFLIGTGSGYRIKSVLVDAELTERLLSERAALKKAREYNRQLSEVALKKQAETREHYNEIIRNVYIPRIQTVNSNCNISNSTQRMLNSIVTMQLPPRTPIAENTGSSEITEKQFIGYAADVMNMYNNAKIQCNALIESVKNR